MPNGPETTPTWDGGISTFAAFDGASSSVGVGRMINIMPKVYDWYYNHYLLCATSKQN